MTTAFLEDRRGIGSAGGGYLTFSTTLVPGLKCAKWETQAGKGGEIQLTDGIASLLNVQAAYGFEYEGIRYDCGSKAGLFQATLELGRKYHGL